jgi:hypothetical protein
MIHTFTGASAAFAWGQFDSSGNASINNQANANLLFATNNTERARIDANGRLLVGTTSAITGNFINFVNNSAETSVLISKTSGTAGNLPLALYNSANTGDNVFAFFFVNTTPASVGVIDFNRGAGLTRYNTTSDSTLKNVIGDADGSKSLQILSTTRIREYAWKDDPSQKPQIGVIAQELYETFKGAVSVGGEQDDGKYRPWGVDKTAFTFHLVAGWQAHEKLIKELKAELDATKAEVALLKGAA